MTPTFSRAAPPKSGVVAVPVYQDAGFGEAAEGLDQASGGALSRAAKAAGFVGKPATQADVFGAEGIAPHVVLIGVGKPETFDLKAAEAFGGAASARALKTDQKALALLVDDLEAVDVEPADLAARIGFAARLRSYRFDKYRTTGEGSEKPSLAKVAVHGAAATAAKARYADLDAIADGVFLTRDLVSEPANVLYPESFAERCRELESLGLEVEVLGEAQMKKLGMGALLGVGQGSVRESKLAVMKWSGGKKAQKPIAFVGKGVCFDTGGISLKPPANMEDMKWDMGGAGAVTGAMAAIAGRKAKANVVGVVGLVENMPDGAAQRPGDVVTSMSGQTIEILNTDAEGRLVLADALWYVQEKYKPTRIVDLATLTGAILVSLAHEYAGLFTNDEEFAEDLIAAGAAVGEKLWRMPLDKSHDDDIKSPIADMKNIGGRWAGSSTAAAFLKRFIKDGGAEWAHLDIAGMAWLDKDTATAPKGGAGFGVRLLDEYVRRFAE
ncbi:MAG: leucyl aminopeptidase [Pseudomonadota bacterium]